MGLISECLLTVLLIQLLLSHSEATVALVGVQEGSTLDLNKERTCNSAWTFKDLKISEPFEVKKNSTGDYKCSDPDEVLLVIVTGAQRFSPMNYPLISGESTVMICSFDYYLSNFEATGSKLHIADDKGTTLADKSSIKTKEDRTEISCDLAWKVEGEGEKNFTCTWWHEIKYQDSTYSIKNELLLAIVIFVKVSNVRVDKTDVYLYYTVECMADGFPEAMFQWQCQGKTDHITGPWLAENSRLTLTRPSKFNCSCTASNVIDDTEYTMTKSWIIRGLETGPAEEEELEEGDRVEKARIEEEGHAKDRKGKASSTGRVVPATLLAFCSMFYLAVDEVKPR